MNSQFEQNESNEERIKMFSKRRMFIKSMEYPYNILYGNALLCPQAISLNNSIQLL